MEQVMDIPRRRQAAPCFGDLLKHWRSARRMSQLELASEAEISARHLSFLETGRAQPSRDMIHLLGSALDIPFFDQNALLLAAGYAPRYAHREIDAPELEQVRHALEYILKQQEPYPAIVIDEAWNIRMRNAASERIFRLFRDLSELPGDRAQNAMHILCHPKGLRRFMANWEEFVGPLIQSIHREAAARNNADVLQLRDELLSYPGMPTSWKTVNPTAAAPPLLTMQLKKDDLHLAFFATLTTLANPHEVTLQQLRVECLFPADKATEETARRLADSN
jgi:transcriptional regulator with XRE-family HTH domain